MRLPGPALSCPPSMTKDSSFPPVEHGESEPPIAEGTAIAVAFEASAPEAVQHETPPLVVVTASHQVLFQAQQEIACDACGQPLPLGDDLDEFGVGGCGVYMWTRGDSVRFEKAPLCPSCASAIGMTALGRWEIEEEEG